MGDKPGFFKKLLFEDDTEKKEVVAEEAPAEQAKTNTVVAAPAPNAVVPQQVAQVPVGTPQQFIQTPQVDENMLNQILGEIEKSNLSGPDYFEFTKAMEAMVAIPMQENMKYQTVFMTMSTQGLTKEYLLESANHYLKVLEKENQVFHTDMQGHKENVIVGKQNQLVKNGEHIQTLVEKMTELQNEINEIKQASIVTQQELTEEENKIALLSSNFEATVAYVQSNIEGNVQKIQSYIQ